MRRLYLVESMVVLSVLLTACSDEHDTGLLDSGSATDVAADHHSMTDDLSVVTDQGQAATDLDVSTTDIVEDSANAQTDTVDDTSVVQPDTIWPDSPDFNEYAVLPSNQIPIIRGQVTKRGQIHSHTIYSHDGCDSHGISEDGSGVCDDYCTSCFWDYRSACCDSLQDFAFITDHPDAMARYEFPDILLYDEASGDELIYRDGKIVANRIFCGEERRPVVLAQGMDKHLLAFGLEGHARDTIDERFELYTAKTPESCEELKKAGALVVSGYSDEWDPELLYSLPLDGYEVYNPVTNLRNDMETAVTLVMTLMLDPDNAPAPEVGMAAMFSENDEAMTRWANVVNKRRVFNYIGTNAHQNTFPDQTKDGERLDSWRRLFHWFTNFVRVPEGVEVTDKALKDSIKTANLYGVAEFLGTPVGFDFHAERDGVITEMGGEISDKSGVTLHVTLPKLWGKPTGNGTNPTIRGVIYRSVEDDPDTEVMDAHWEQVADSTEDFSYNVTEDGIYRSTVRITPTHLNDLLQPMTDDVMREMLWIYGNPIWIGDVYGE